MNKLIRSRWKRAQFLLLIAVLSAVGPSSLSLAFKHLPRLLVFVLGVAFFLAMVLLILHTMAIEEERESLVQKISGLEGELQRQSLKEREEATQLFSKTVEYTTTIMRSISENLQTIQIELNNKLINDDIRSYLNKKEKLFAISRKLKEDIINGILKNVVIIFESDARGLDTTTYPYNYFKSALFEVEVEKGGNKIFLHRTAYYYPEGVEPHKETERVDIDQYPRAAHVLAYKTQEIIIIEDIPSEAKKPAEEARWIDIRHNQSADYKSMICVPIVRGKRETPNREVLAVLVIDTNRERYFLGHNPQYLAFLGRIMSSFRTLTSIAFDIERFKNYL